MPRISRPEYYMRVAELTAERGTCNKMHVGCVLVNPQDHRIASVGYNSSARKSIHCCDSTCLIVDGHCIRTLHAEQAAVLNLTKTYDVLECYTTHCPCINCFKILVGAGVILIYYKNYYKDESRDLLNKEIGIRFIQMDDSYMWSNVHQ